MKKSTIDRQSMEAYYIYTLGMESTREFGSLKFIWGQIGKQFRLAVFSGRKIKPRTDYYFQSLEMLQERIEFLVTVETRDMEYTAERVPDNSNVEVGDVFSASYGYEQTNVSYYQVTKKIGKTMIELTQIRGEAVQEETLSSMSGYKRPCVNQFVEGTEKRVKISKNGECSISQCATARPLAFTVVDGQKVYESQYYSTYA